MNKLVLRAFIGLLSFSFLFPVFQSHTVLLASFTDDFYYYLKIASNFLNGDGLSFAKGYPTNGYQPLFQLTVIILHWLANLLHIEVLLFIRIVFSILFFLLCNSCLRITKPVGLTGKALFAAGLSAYFALACSGMEVLLLIPLLFIFCFKVINKQLDLIQLSLWITLLFFTRIDSLVITIPVGLLYTYSIWRQGRLEITRLAIPAIIFIVPVLAYCLYNYLSFGVLFPVSGLAKSVKQFNGLNHATFRSLFRADGVYRAIIFPPVLLALFLLVFNTNKKLRNIIAVSLALTIFYFIQNSIRSDWPLWPWYFFAFPVLLLLISTLPVNNAFSFKNLYQLTFSSIVAGTVMLSLLAAAFQASFYYVPVAIPSTLNENGFRIKAFEASHTGTYAMGDRAGIVGYLLDNPLIQLEGLVMDKSFLQHSDSVKCIKDLLRPYDVKYYVASNPENLGNGKYVVVEPIQLVNSTYAIRDTLDWPVLTDFDIQRTRRINTSSILTYKTVIFEVPR